MAQPGEFLKPVSAMLTRALAEAAAGSPIGSPNGVYFVASYMAVPSRDDTNPPSDDLPADTHNGYFNIQPAFASHAVALARATQLGPGYGVFGPFNSTFITPTPGQPTVSTITITTSDNGTVTIPSPGFIPSPGITPPPPEFDALFFTPEAVAKFALPYYSEVYSNGFGNEVLTQFQSAKLALMGHMPWSEYTDIDPDGPPAATPGTGGTGGTGPAREIPVIFEPDGQGGYHKRPIYPSAPAPAGAP
jgi:hypothetical protein